MENGELAVVAPLVRTPITVIVGFTERDPSGSLYSSAAPPTGPSADDLWRRSHGRRPSVAVLVTVLRSRLHTPKMTVGLLSGTAVGIVLLVLLSARIFGLMNEVPSTCACEPIIDQVRFSSRD